MLTPVPEMGPIASIPPGASVPLGEAVGPRLDLKGKEETERFAVEYQFDLSIDPRVPIGDAAKNPSQLTLDRVLDEGYADRPGLAFR